MDEKPPTYSNYDFCAYLYHSFLYYELDSPVISDHEYDALCKKLLAGWDNLTYIGAKQMAPRDALEAGTGYQLTGQWPLWVYDKARRDGIEHVLLGTG